MPRARPGLRKRPLRGWDPKFDKDHLDVKAEDRKSSDLERERSRTSKSHRVWFSEPAEKILRELRDRTRNRRDPTRHVTFSELVELLIAHWETNPPKPEWIFNFKFVTKRGPMKGSKKNQALASTPDAEEDPSLDDRPSPEPEPPGSPGR